jgi:hypothetical protein
MPVSLAKWFSSACELNAIGKLGSLMLTQFQCLDANRKKQAGYAEPFGMDVSPHTHRIVCDSQLVI